jgi:hypothetical protein
MRSTSQISCSIVFPQNATIYVSFASTSLYWPLWGCIFKCAGFILSKEPGVGSRAYIPTCLPVALDEDGSSLQLWFMLCTRKVEDLCNWIFVVISMLLQWLLYFVLWCYLLIQGMAHSTQVFHLNLKVGRYRMVSEHSVACRIETLGLD